MWVKKEEEEINPTRLERTTRSNNLFFLGTSNIALFHAYENGVVGVGVNFPLMLMMLS